MAVAMITTGRAVASGTVINRSKIQGFKHEVGKKVLELSFCHFNKQQVSN